MCGDSFRGVALDLIRVNLRLKIGDSFRGVLYLTRVHLRNFGEFIPLHIKSGEERPLAFFCFVWLYLGFKVLEL